jgi:hypothetical protein
MGNMIETLDVTALYAGLNALLLLVLAGLVVRQRQKYEVGLGYGGQEDLERAARAMGNLTEYLPTALIVLVVLEVSGFADIWLHVLGSLFTLGRIAHAVGLSSTSGRSVGRMFGILATWAYYLIGGMACLSYGLAGLG